MGQRDKKPPFSLHAFVEQTARMLREAAKPAKRGQTYSGDANLSSKSKIMRIASLLRSKAKKSKSKKNRSD